jgi:hypothetical protein
MILKENICPFGHRFGKDFVNSSQCELCTNCIRCVNKFKERK